MAWHTLVAVAALAVSMADALSSSSHHQRLDFLQGPDPLHLDPALDCGMRKLAYDYSLTLLPERAPLTSVFDALRLGSECGLPPPSDAAAAAAVVNGGVFIPTNAAATYYADPVRGDDSGSGSMASPFRTIARAVEAARGASPPATIVLRNGTFYLPAAVSLNAADSGLTIVAYPGETPVLSGGVPLPTLAWTLRHNATGGGGLSPVQPSQNNVGSCGINAPGQSSDECKYNGTAPDVGTCASHCAANTSCTSYTYHDSSTGDYALCCYFRIDGVWAPYSQSGHFSGYKLPALSYNVWSADVSGTPGLPLPFDTLFSSGRRAIRARYPNGNPETNFQPAGFTSASGWSAPTPAPAPQEIHVSTPQRAFDPFFPAFQWGLGGTCASFDPPEGFWCTKSPPAGNQYNVPSGFSYNPAQQFPNAANWSNVAGGIVHAFHDGYWGDWAFSVGSVNAAAGSITFSRGGWQEARGSGGGGVLYIENLLEELDAPGEWYLSPNGTLYFNFNASINPNAAPSQPALLATNLASVLTVSASVDAPAVNVSLLNLTFAHTAPTFMRAFESGGGGDFSFHRGGAVLLEGSVGTVIAGCTFMSPGGNALTISGYNRNVTVSRNHFAFVGDSAILSHGRGSGSMDAIHGEYPSGTRIQYNLMRELGLYVKQSGAYYAGLSPEATLIGNVAFNMPRAGININDGFGGGHLISSNLIFNTVRETSDHGCFNSWDRQPYIVHAGNITDLLPHMSYISNNFLINNYHSTWPIDHDDGSNSYVDSGNLMLWGGFKNYLGFAKQALDNLYIFPDASVSMTKMRMSADALTAHYGAAINVSARAGGWPYCVGSMGTSAFPAALKDAWVNNTCIVSTTDQIYDFDGCNVNNPLDGHVPTISGNQLWVGSGTYAFPCDTAKWTLAQAQAKGMEVGTTITMSLPTTAQILDMARAKLGM